MKTFNTIENHKGLQIKIFDNGQTFVRVQIEKDGQFVNQLTAKRGDAIREGKRYIDTIH